MKKGFTLLEVIISIAALTLISVFILQMFMASSRLNQRASDADRALAAAVTEIEALKSHTSLSEYIATVDTRMLAEIPATLSIYYDKDWIRAAENGAGQPETARFILSMDIHADDENIDGLYQVDVQVQELDSERDNRTLAALQTKKYFSDKPEGGAYADQ